MHREDEKCMYFGQPEGKKSLRGCRYNLQDNIKMEMKEIG
jgi:hypothetical protein